MQMPELIQKKRDGLELSSREIHDLIKGYVHGAIPDYQMAAWAMAVYFRGMTAQETAELTLAMAQSGDQLKLSLPGKIFVDKHSSGGVGDKTTLVVAPLVAACGVPVAKMSGRGLGHTGGTIDKLASIPGLRLELSQQEFLDQVGRIGIAVIAQTGDIVPADKKLYGLRDVTATVDSIPLIASSIMSKKIAAGAQAIVLDVKYGSGAFMQTEEEAEVLARTMVAIGNNLNRQTVAVLSAMSQPLGRAVGNSLEVLEVIDTLHGNGPADLVELSLELGSWMLVLGQRAASHEQARELLTTALANGAAWAKFLEFIGAQGGDIKAVQQKELALAPLAIAYKAPASGFIEAIDARAIGVAAMKLGAGRETKDSAIDLGAGIYLHKTAGDKIEPGDTILTLYTSDPGQTENAFELIENAVQISVEPPVHTKNKRLKAITAMPETSP